MVSWTHPRAVPVNCRPFVQAKREGEARRCAGVGMKRKPNTPSFKEAPQLPQNCYEGTRTEELFWCTGKWLVSEQGWQKRCASKFCRVQSTDSWKEGKGIWKNKGGNAMEDNPIRNRCPAKQHVSELKKTMAASSGCVHVHDMTDWVVRQPGEMMAGTEFEGKWHWRHDALSITWAPETIQCIKERCPGVHERVRVLRGLGPADADEIKICRKNDAGELTEEMTKNRHKGKLGGDAPRNTPLDSSLF